MKFDATLTAKHQLDILAALQPFTPEVELVGTMFINGEGNDYDYVVFEPEGRQLDHMADDLEARGFKRSSPESKEESGNEDGWVALRKGKANVMLTTDPEFFEQFKAAARVCKYVQGLASNGEISMFDPLTREQRIKIHRIIMNGEEP